MCHHYTIGQLAEKANVPRSTVRYYERRGLLQPDGRSKGNYRVYGEGAVDRLLFLRAAQGAGFTLADIGVLLSFRDGASSPCKEVQSLIANRLALVGEKLEHLRGVDSMLRHWLKVCKEAERTGRCGVLEGLMMNREEKCKKGQERA